MCFNLKKSQWKAEEINVLIKTLLKDVVDQPYMNFSWNYWNEAKTFRKISKNLKDAFIQSGNGFGQTYVGAFPSFRIDYILHSSSFKSYNYQTIQEELSDHYPITTQLNLK